MSIGLNCNSMRLPYWRENDPCFIYIRQYIHTQKWRLYVEKPVSIISCARSISDVSLLQEQNIFENKSIVS